MDEVGAGESPGSGERRPKPDVLHDEDGDDETERREPEQPRHDEAEHEERRRREDEPSVSHAATSRARDGLASRTSTQAAT